MGWTTTFSISTLPSALRTIKLPAAHGGSTPRDLGFDAGSALSTASFKDFAWGITSLYWNQVFADEKIAFVFGQMDPGDFMDAYPLLSAWTAFMSDAFFNNPAEALPQQGVGFVTRLYVDDHYYFSGGVHDALADADGVNVAELFDGEDLFYWVEVGWSPSRKSAPGDSIHLTYWQQDELEELGTEKSRGLALSVAPVEPDTGTQMTSEVFYRLQMTDNLQVTPALQITRNPSFNDLKSAIYVGSVLRMRLAF